MRSLVIYESMYGNTHLIADAIGAGLREAGDVEVVHVDEANVEEVSAADLVVAGGPTHAHSMSRPSTRKAAIESVEKNGPDLSLDPDAAGEGVREWLASLGDVSGMAAAFDTRVDVPPALSGRASKGIAKHLRRHGFEMVADPESFLVTKENVLEPDEEERARAWGARLAETMIRAERASA